MTPAKEELIEKMARTIDLVAWSDMDPIDYNARQRSLWEATAALAAIESAGLAIMPMEASDGTLSVWRETAKSVADLPLEERFAAVYRAMVEFGRVK